MPSPSPISPRLRADSARDRPWLDQMTLRQFHRVVLAARRLEIQNRRHLRLACCLGRMQLFANAHKFAYQQRTF
jgi:hypothetical protein